MHCNLYTHTHHYYDIYIYINVCVCEREKNMLQQACYTISLKQRKQRDTERLFQSPYLMNLVFPQKISIIARMRLPIYCHIVDFHNQALKNTFLFLKLTEYLSLSCRFVFFAFHVRKKMVNHRLKIQGVQRCILPYCLLAFKMLFKIIIEEQF